MATKKAAKKKAVKKAPTEKAGKKVTQESELHDLAIQRTRDLEGLTRKDRAKISKITSQFHQDHAEIQKKWANKKANDQAKAEAEAEKKSKEDQKKADARAKKKQSDK